MVTILGVAHSREELSRVVGDHSQVFGVDLVVHGNGIERGNRVLTFRTGSGLRFDLQVDRAMDLAGLEYRGVPIGWHSPAGFRSPALHEFDAEDGFSWARSFSGLMNSCGLDHVHAPERDTAAHFHHEPRPSISHALHGRIGNTPAMLTGYGRRWDGDRCFLFATAEVRQGTVFGENLVLERRVEVEVGTSTIIFDDTVRNLGFNETPHAYMWHINMGWPLMDKGARVLAPIAETPWRLRADEADEAGPLVQAGPRSPAGQQVYDHRLRSPKGGLTRAALVNDHFSFYGLETGVALEIAYDASTMPSLFEWQFFQSGNYVVALEPCSVHAGSRADWRERGEFKLLGHNQTAHYRLELTPHLGLAAIDEMAQRLA